MGNFSTGLIDTVNKIVGIVNPVAMTYGGKVVMEYANRITETPIAYMLISVGVESVISNSESLGYAYIDDEVLAGDTVEATFSVIYHAPIETNGYSMFEAFMKVADAFSISHEVNCSRIECGPISFDRNKRTIVMKSYFTVKFVV